MKYNIKAAADDSDGIHAYGDRHYAWFLNGDRIGCVCHTKGPFTGDYQPRMARFCTHVGCDSMAPFGIFTHYATEYACPTHLMVLSHVFPTETVLLDDREDLRDVLHWRAFDLDWHLVAS